MNTKVSVCMITYNHAKYIEKAVESVAAQKTNFAYELVIGEDCSTDNTRHILQQLQTKYPDLIKLNLQDKNVGPQPNFISTYQRCTGKYIAMLEGDDYWTHPHKLQKQVDFLDSNPDFVMCFHNVEVQDEAGNCSRANTSGQEVFSVKDVISREWFIMTCSIVFRNGLVQFPAWFNQVKNGDYTLQLLVSQHGPIRYLDEVMGVYRKHGAGASAEFRNQVVFCRSLLFVLTRFNRHSAYRHRHSIRQRTRQLHQALARAGEKYPGQAWEAAYDQSAFWLVRLKNKLRLLLGHHP